MINPDKRMLLRQLKRIERDLEEGRISREEYSSLKERYTEELETLEAVENIRKLQGQKSPEKPLDHWVEESRRKKDETEKRELMKRYISSEETREKPRVNLSLIGTIILVLAFFFGTGFGLYFMNPKTETPATGTVTVNESAFPSFNNTLKNTTRVVNQTSAPTINETPSTPAQPSRPPENQQGPGDQNTPGNST